MSVWFNIKIVVLKEPKYPGSFCLIHLGYFILHQEVLKRAHKMLQLEAYSCASHFQVPEAAVVKHSFVLWVVYLLPSESCQDQAIPICLFLYADQTVLLSVPQWLQKLDLKGFFVCLILLCSVKVNNTSTLESLDSRFVSTAALERAVYILLGGIHQGG